MPRRLQLPLAMPLLIIAGILAASAEAAPATGFSTAGYGPALAGSSQSQIERLLHQELQPERPASNTAKPAGAASASDCRMLTPQDFPDLRFALRDGVLTRVETRSAAFKSISGVQVGDSIDRVRQVYGPRMTESPHPYFDHGRLLMVPSRDQRSALVMETNDDGRVITLRAGRVPDVTWLEACS